MIMDTCKLTLQKELEKLSAEARELYIPSEVPRIEYAPNALQFYREFVAANNPVIIRNSINHWSCFRKWTNEYLRSKVGEKSVTVAVTPNGYADAPLQDRFVLPEERTLKFKEFLDIMKSNEGKTEPDELGIFYIQKQNSNLTEEFSELISDTDTHIDWASEAFGKRPDAVNFWMGDGRAITSMHKDHYENLYAVIRGKKTFILHPPTDVAHIPHKLYKAAKYKSVNGGFEVEDLLVEDKSPNCVKISLKQQEVPWISINPLQPDFEKYPQYAKSKPITCEVNPGEILYLPSLWFHHVTQVHGTIAINFWYDMEYDIKYNYFKFIESVSNVIK